MNKQPQRVRLIAAAFNAGVADEAQVDEVGGHVDFGAVCAAASAAWQPMMHLNGVSFEATFADTLRALFDDDG